MSHSFLPVNPCCTDVVLNSPCGCTSTLPNTGCGQNPCETNVILSSNVLYNGPILDCIIAEPCDTLNVILQKIDEIICNLLTQINTLNIQVANITTQIININNEITNINNTLAVCCGATTTTTTTAVPCACTTYRLVGPSVNPGSVAYVPCGSTEVVTQTATNIVELICVDNTTGVIRVGNVSFINLLTCCAGPTTTTTTTLPIPTYCYTLTANGKVVFYWIDVNGDPQSASINNTTIYVCAQLGSIATSGTGLPDIEGGIALCTSDLDCAVIPTTTTTTTLAPTTTTTTTSLAYCYSLTAEGKVKFYWTDVNGVAQTITITNNTTYVCAQLGSVIADGPSEIEGGITLCTNNSQCVPTTTTTTTVPPSTTTTTSSSSTTTTTTTVKSCSTYRIIASGPSESPGDSDWSAIDCYTGLPVGGTVAYPINSDTACIVNGSLVLGVKLSILATDSCSVFELEPTCCDVLEFEYMPLPSSTPIGTVVYATNGYCYTVVSTSLLSPTVAIGDTTTYANCGECTTEHPCPTTTTTTTAL